MIEATIDSDHKFTILLENKASLETGISLNDSKTIYYSYSEYINKTNVDEETNTLLKWEGPSNQ